LGDLILEALSGETEMASQLGNLGIWPSKQLGLTQLGLEPFLKLISSIPFRDFNLGGKQRAQEGKGFTKSRFFSKKFLFFQPKELVLISPRILRDSVAQNALGIFPRNI